MIQARSYRRIAIITKLRGDILGLNNGARETLKSKKINLKIDYKKLIKLC